jgi:hypothetical protein
VRVNPHSPADAGADSAASDDTVILSTRATISGGPLAAPVVLFATHGRIRAIGGSVLIELWTLHTTADNHA